MLKNLKYTPDTYLLITNSDNPINYHNSIIDDEFHKSHYTSTYFYENVISPKESYIVIPVNYKIEEIFKLTKKIRNPINREKSRHKALLIYATCLYQQNINQNKIQTDLRVYKETLEDSYDKDYKDHINFLKSTPIPSELLMNISTKYSQHINKFKNILFSPFMVTVKKDYVFFRDNGDGTVTEVKGKRGDKYEYYSRKKKHCKRYKISFPKNKINSTLLIVKMVDSTKRKKK